MRPEKNSDSETTGGRRLRVAHVASSISMNTILRGQLLKMSAAGLDVSAVCALDEWSREVEARGIPVLDGGTARTLHPLRIISSFFKVYRELKRGKFDIVHTHNAVPGFTGRLAARAAGVPVVVHTSHSWPFQSEPFIKSRMYAALERFAARLSDAVMVQNQDDADAALRLRVVPGSKCYLIGNGIDPDPIAERAAAADRRLYHSEFRIGNDVKIITMVARLEEVKGHEFFLEMFSGLIKEFPKAVTLFIGYGRDTEKIKRAAGRLVPANSVRFLGHRSDIPEILGISDICVLTSKKEGLPRSLLEAMAAGVPVVGTDVPGTRQLIDHGVTGLLVPFGDRDVLMSSILGILTGMDKNAAVRAKNAFVTVKNRYSESSLVRRQLVIYERLSAYK